MKESEDGESFFFSLLLLLVLLLLLSLLCSIERTRVIDETFVFFPPRRALKFV